MSPGCFLAHVAAIRPTLRPTPCVSVGIPNDANPIRKCGNSNVKQATPSSPIHKGGDIAPKRQLHKNRGQSQKVTSQLSDN
ncbi:MAG: hypothetical protein NTW74_10350 [Acidobacteria bacterium]|nr:hypothetical protein [Acidobacteriota bacterium]